MSLKKACLFILIVLTISFSATGAVFATTPINTEISRIESEISELDKKIDNIKIDNMTYIYGQIVSTNPFVVMCPLAISTQGISPYQYHIITEPNNDWISGAQYSGYHPFTTVMSSSEFGTAGVYGAATEKMKEYDTFLSQKSILEQNLEDMKNEKDGKTTIRYNGENGKYGTYVGTVKNGVPDGYGVYSNGPYTVYQGEYKDGLYHGYGEWLRTSTELYKGIFRNGKLISKDGLLYNEKMLLFVDIPYIERETETVAVEFLKIDVAPTIKNGRTLVPLRAVVESLGGTVEWYDNENKIVIKHNKKNITMHLNQSTATVDGTTASLDVSPQIINNRTLIPLRFVSENLGYKVDWDNINKTIKISETEAIIESLKEVVACDVWFKYKSEDEYDISGYYILSVEIKLNNGESYKSDYDEELGGVVELDSEKIFNSTDDLKKYVNEELKNSKYILADNVSITIDGELAPQDMSSESMEKMRITIDSENTSSEEDFVIEGKLYDQYDPSPTVTINGEEVTLDSFSDTAQSFSYQVTLSGGENKFVIEASNKYGQTATETEVITFASKPPELKVFELGTVITPYVKVSGKFSGNGDITIYVNGDNNVDMSYGTFEYEIELEEGENIIEVEAVNEYGEKTTKTIKAIYTSEE